MVPATATEWGERLASIVTLDAGSGLTVAKSNLWQHAKSMRSSIGFITILSSRTKVLQSEFGAEVNMTELTRTGVSIEEDLLQQFDQLIARRGYKNRSEAIRDLIRESLVNGRGQ